MFHREMFTIFTKGCDMKFLVQFQGDSFDDRDDLLLFVKSGEILSHVEECRSRIKRRIKHSSIDGDQEAFLEDILELLYFEDFN